MAGWGSTAWGTRRTMAESTFGGLIAAGLLVYLVAALLFPEDFL